MKYPLSQPGLDLNNGKFTDGVPGVKPASVIPSSTMNALVDEVTHVIRGADLTPEENNNTQMLTAIQILIDRTTLHPAYLYFIGQL